MRKWSKAELVKLQKQFKTDAAIGKQFGITRQAVHQMRQKFGVKSVKNKNKERNEAIKNAYLKGKYVGSIAHATGLSISQVYRIVKS